MSAAPGKTPRRAARRAGRPSARTREPELLLLAAAATSGAGGVWSWLAVLRFRGLRHIGRQSIDPSEAMACHESNLFNGMIHEFREHCFRGGVAGERTGRLSLCLVAEQFLANPLEGVVFADVVHDDPASLHAVHVHMSVHHV